MVIPPSPDHQDLISGISLVLLSVWVYLLSRFISNAYMSKDKS